MDEKTVQNKNVYKPSRSSLIIHRLYDVLMITRMQEGSFLLRPSLSGRTPKTTMPSFEGAFSRALHRSLIVSCTNMPVIIIMHIQCTYV